MRYKWLDVINCKIVSRGRHRRWYLDRFEELFEGLLDNPTKSRRNLLNTLSYFSIKLKGFTCFVVHSQFAITHTSTHKLSLSLSLSLSLIAKYTHPSTPSITHTGMRIELHNNMLSHRIDLKLWNRIHIGGGRSWSCFSLSLSWSRGQLQTTSFIQNQNNSSKMILKLFLKTRKEAKMFFDVCVVYSDHNRSDQV